jgi:hypothetical protein
VADSEWLYITGAVAVAVAAAAIALFLLYTTRNERKGKKEPPEKPPSVEARESWITRSLKTERTVSVDDAKKARDELRALDLEREVLSFAIRRLYEAQAEGKITEEERERLAQWYKSRMMQVRDTIARSESVVALHELETMQGDLVKLFSERFDELGNKVEELRTQLQLKSVEEEAPSPVTPELSPEPSTAESEKEKKKARKKPAPKEPPRKTETEKRIEEIKAEVEKVLERLGQIEVEG